MCLKYLAPESQRAEDLDAGARAVPAFVVMVVNRGDWLKRLVYSLDLPIRKLVLVHNVLPFGPDPSETFAAIAELVAEFGPRHVRALTFNRNLGVSRSLNLAFKMFPERYWIVADADFAYQPGEFKRVVDAIDPAPSGPNSTNGAENNARVVDVVMAPQFRNWAARSTLVEKIGYFDENFWPAYVEDCDYHLRMLLHGNVSLVEMGVAHLHGEGDAVAV